MKNISVPSINLKRKKKKSIIYRGMVPFQSFFQAEASSGILLIICTVAALIWANSGWSAYYVELWRQTFTIGFEGFALSKPLILWINDGLMAIFFLVVGLEIKREVMVGELSSPRQAALPIAAAVGGMVVPAAFYLLFNAGTPGMRGWGIPMATDIAFAIGILSLLGNRVPISLKIFLTALAIADDIGAVLVIAFFYTAEISWFALAMGGVFLLLLVGLNRAGARSRLVYMVFGFGMWVAFLKSGIHPTVAGVLLAFAIPARTLINTREFLEDGKAALEDFAAAGESGESILTNKDQQSAISAVEKISEGVQTPLQHLEHSLHPWVAYGIMPLFAFANAGVTIEGDLWSAITHPIALGIMAGLVLGKQIGITAVSWLFIRFNLADLPSDANWRQMYGIGFLGGVGFTMSLFVGSLAFVDPQYLAVTKVGILMASMMATVGGWILLRWGSSENSEPKT